MYSTDEKTGIQALEHIHKSRPMRSGNVERCEQEYKRHGTQCLITSRNIATGKIVSPEVLDTRTEEDFARHIDNVISLTPDNKIIFIMDNLNTHLSESVVKVIAKHCNIDISFLGEKGKSGILKNMDSRRAFITDSSHKIYFVFTPKHCSWLNQIEMWFSILSRSLLNKRMSFKSIVDLKSKILSYIEHYNTNLAKPFKWTTEGKLLRE